MTDPAHAGRRLSDEPLAAGRPSPSTTFCLRLWSRPG